MGHKNTMYLIVADESAEFSKALRFAAKQAHANGVRVGILYVMPKEGEFLHWGNVEALMESEKRTAAEAFLLETARKVYSFNGVVSALFIAEGQASKAIIDVINDNLNIAKLVLGGSTHSGGPGPLTDFFAHKGLSQLRVPLTIVPDHIEEEDIDRLV